MQQRIESRQEGRVAPRPQANEQAMLTPAEEGAQLQDAVNVIKTMKWLAPLDNLECFSSTEFGRNIRKSLKDLSANKGVVSLTVNNSEAAVVMTKEHYNHLLDLKLACNLLIQDKKKHILADLGDQFQNLYDQMQTTTARAAGDALFNASDEDFKQAYRPGRTETIR